MCTCCWLFCFCNVERKRKKQYKEKQNKNKTSNYLDGGQLIEPSEGMTVTLPWLPLCCVAAILDCAVWTHLPPIPLILYLILSSSIYLLFFSVLISFLFFFFFLHSLSLCSQSFLSVFQFFPYWNLLPKFIKCLKPSWQIWLDFVVRICSCRLLSGLLL